LLALAGLPRADRRSGSEYGSFAPNAMPGLDDLSSAEIAGLTDVKCQFTYDTPIPIPLNEHEPVMVMIHLSSSPARGEGVH
jgi:hypothetical protein